MKKTLEDLLFEMGAAVGQAFVRGVESKQKGEGRKLATFTGKSSLVAAHSRFKAASVSDACCIPECHRSKAAKGLCSNHYGKAKRLKMNLDKKLSAAQRKTLAADGRKK